MDILELVDALEPNLEGIKGNLRKIADIHIAFYRFYIRFATRCEALVFDKKSRDYLEKCIEFLQTKKLTSKAIQQSRGNLMKMLDSLNDLCVSLGGDKRMLSKIYTVIDQAVGDESSESTSEAGGALDLLKQLKNLLNDPVDDELSDTPMNPTSMDVRPSSPADSSASSTPEHETSRTRGGVEPMTQYLLSDSGMDNYYYNYTKDFKNVAITCEMNNIMSKTGTLRENKYTGLDNMVAKMKINVPIWNYNIDRVDTIDTNNVMENMEIFEGNKSVTDAVLYSCPDFLSVGPFEVYLRNKVFVYHCLVNNCNDCMTTSLEYLKLHVKFTHGESDIDWNCSACDLINMHSASQRSLDGALDHLAKYHSMKTTYTLSKERLMEINEKIADDAEGRSVCPEIKGEEENKEDFNLFHCPYLTCEFSTNSLTAAFGHFSSIVKSDQAFRCRYCPFISFSNYEYCQHLVKNHGNSRYRCGYCPYRSVSKTNSVFHQRDIHPDMPHKILGFEPIASAEYKYDCRAHNSLKYFMCYESCDFSTLVEQKYTIHLLDHAGVTIICRYCSKYENSDISELRDHLLLHGVGEYHCLYCKEAFNFILKAERHLHQSHPSKYPFIVVCQDFDSRSHSLRGKYNKIQKLDIGSESIIVVALESDKSVCSVEITNSSEAIVIEDIDHCKMQLKYFLKNTYEDLPEITESNSQLPHVIETLDLTQCDDPRDRVDIKPRIRVRNIEQLRSSWLFENSEHDIESSSALSFEGVPSTSSSFMCSTPHQELQSPFNLETLPSASGSQLETEVLAQSPLLTPAQIKKEIVSGTTNDENVTAETVPDQIPIEPAFNPDIQIKKEKNDCPKSPNKKRKAQSKPSSAAARVKLEASVTQDGEVVIDEGPRIHSVQTWDENEGNAAAAAIMEIESTQIQDTVSTPSTSSHDEAATLPDTSKQLESSGTAGVLTCTPVRANPVNESIQQSFNVPILNAHSIADMPVDFDCGIIQQSDTVDQKFGLNADGTFAITPLRYNDPTIVDTVIISDGDEDEDFFSSPALPPSPSRPGPCKSPIPSTSKALVSELQTNPSGPTIISTHSATSVGELQPSSGDGNSNLLKISSAGTFIPIEPNPSQPSTYLLIQANSANTSVQNLAPAPQPVPETKKYRCKLCQFISEDRQKTYEHLYNSHPNKLSERVRKLKINHAQKVISGDITVKGVSCPYCPDKVYEGVKSFERHHSLEHGDFSEVKCFIIYPVLSKLHPERVFACSFCGTFCCNEEAVWQHTLSVHNQRIKIMKKPISLRAIVALKKMVCPLYNCLEEFLQPTMFRLHMQSHPTVIACKTCTYIADTIEAFQAFHDELDPVERLTHFFYHKSKEDIANLVNVQRFSNPLYSLNSVILDDQTPKKTTARKSTGAQYNR